MPMNALRVILFVLLAVSGCSSADAGDRLIVAHVVQPRPPVALVDDAPAPVQRPTTPRAPADPYAGWSEWCAPVVLPLCKTAADCPGTEPSGKPWKCVKVDEGTHRCMGSWPTRSERERERARLRTFVDLRCGKGCNATKLHSLLSLVALRESTLRPWKRHRLNGDVRANREGWLRYADRYGHEQRVAKVRGKDRLAGVRFTKDGNPHYRERERWETGLGLYGMNAAGWTGEWSVDAPPEVLCRDVEASEAYLRRARRALRKLNAGIDCDHDGTREWHGAAGRPTWYDVHRAASGGKLCPSASSRAQFEPRARAAGLDPYEPITSAMLGEPIPRDVQDTMAAVLRSAMAAAG